MDDRKRDSDGFVGGASPIKYRLIFEMDPPINSHKKGADGTVEISRAEFFVDDMRAFFIINSALGLQTTVTRAEAVILETGVILNWKDRNPDEEE